MNIRASCPIAEFHYGIAIVAIVAIIDFIPSNMEKA